MMKRWWSVHEYGEAKSEGRDFVIEAETKEEAIQKAPCQEWGATAEELKCLRIGCTNICTTYMDCCNRCAIEAKQVGCSFEELPLLEGSESEPIKQKG